MTPEQEACLDRPITEMHLPRRVEDSLDIEGIKTIRDLVVHTQDELFEMRNIGDTAIRHIQIYLIEQCHGMSLGMRI